MENVTDPANVWLYPWLPERTFPNGTNASCELDCFELFVGEHEKFGCYEPACCYSDPRLLCQGLPQGTDFLVLAGFLSFPSRVQEARVVELRECASSAGRLHWPQGGMTHSMTHHPC